MVAPKWPQALLLGDLIWEHGDDLEPVSGTYVKVCREQMEESAGNIFFPEEEKLRAIERT